MIVAYFMPHNEGVNAGLITGDEFDSDLTLVDLYEVDGSIKSFAVEEDARAWLTEKFAESEPDVETVPGGERWKSEF